MYIDKGGENVGNPKKLWPYNGKDYTIDEICKIANRSRSSFDALIRKGLTPEEIVNNKPKKGKKLYEYNGKEYTIDELCKIAGIKERRFYELLRKGWTIDQIINRKYIRKTMKGTRLYNIYYDMKDRCHNSKYSAYKRYGARGIKVCNEWLNDKTKFFEWALSNGYNDDLTIDRIDNNKGYSPSNCRWVDKFEQANNTSRSIRLHYNGKLLTVSIFVLIHYF